MKEKSIDEIAFNEFIGFVKAAAIIGLGVALYGHATSEPNDFGPKKEVYQQEYIKESYPIVSTNNSHP